MTRPTFSILVPTYNQSAFLAKALDSLLGQTDPDWEALVVNDGSTDDTADVISGYSRRDGRIRGFNKPNGGTGSALNRALEESRGHWICWLSSDDLFEPDKLARHRLWMQRCPEAKFFFTYFKLLFEQTGQCDDRHDLWGPLPERRFQTLGLLYRNFISGISICAHREAFDAIGLFDASLRYGQDYDRWLRLSARHPGVFIPEWTVTNRNHAGQGSEVFPQACYYDTAKAAIRFINECGFEQLVPLVDTRHFPEALDALCAALAQAARPDAFLYMLGIHPALLFCLYDWINRQPDTAVREALWNRLETTAQPLMCAHAGAFGAMWRNAWLVARLRSRTVARQGLTPEAIACAQTHFLRVHDTGQCEALARYCDQYMPCPAPEKTRAELVGVAIAVFIDPQHDGQAEELLTSAAKLLARAGASVIIIMLGIDRIGYAQGLEALGAPDMLALAAATSGMRPFDVCISWDKPVDVPARRSLQFAARGAEHPDILEAPSACTLDAPTCEALICRCSLSTASISGPPLPRKIASKVKRLLKRAVGR